MPPTQKDINADLKKLRKFISNVFVWLEHCYTGKLPEKKKQKWPPIPIDPRLVHVARPAWDEFSQNNTADELIKDLDLINPTGDTKEKLEDHGLTGKQLKYKLYLVKFAAWGATFGLPGWKLKLINVIDNLLNSLDPTGVAGALKEMKDALVASVPDNG